MLFVCPPLGPGCSLIAKDMLLTGGHKDAGVLSVARPGQYIVCHGTLDAQTAAMCNKLAGERGAHFFDAPFLPNDVFLNATKVNSLSMKQQSGVKVHDYLPFLSGQHTLLISGGGVKTANQVEEESSATLQRIKMLLPWFSDQQVYFGGAAGAASTAVLWLNTMTAMHAAVAVEGLRLWDQLQRTSLQHGQGFDVDAMTTREALWTALGHSDSSSGLLQRRGRIMQHAVEDPTSNIFSPSTNNQEKFFQGASDAPSMRGIAPLAVNTLLENVETVHSALAGLSANTEFPLLTWSTDSLAAAQRCGWGDKDVAVLAQVPSEVIAAVDMEQSPQQPEQPVPRTKSNDATPDIEFY